METTVANETPETPDEVTMLTKIQQAVTELEGLREQMRQDKIVIEREKARTRAILAELRSA